MNSMSPTSILIAYLFLYHGSQKKYRQTNKWRVLAGVYTPAFSRTPTSVNLLVAEGERAHDRD